MKALSRIQRIQNAHSFLSESDCRKLLVFGYQAAWTEVESMLEDGDEVEEPAKFAQMIFEEDIEEFCEMSREDVKNNLAFVEEFILTN